jgi:acetyltransferase-like isoleucine patch superfamily enzyme
MKNKLSYFVQGIWNHLLNKIPSYHIRYLIIKYIYQMDLGHSIHMNVRFYCPWKIKVGDGSNIQHNCFVDGRGGVIIEDNVDITPNVQIITMSHNLNDPKYSSYTKPVTVCKNSVVFTSAIILPGVTIGEGGCIGAGSVVTRSTTEYSIYCGNPALKVKSRNSDIDYKVRYERFFH